MTADRSALVASGAALAASAVFLAWLATGFGGAAVVKVVDNLGLAAAPAVAAAGWAVAAWRERGRRQVRGGWALLGAACASWTLGEAIWTWYELIAGREVPFPSVADAAFLSAVPLIGLTMFRFVSGDQPVVWRARALLDGGIITTALLYASWALVLGPVFRAAPAVSSSRSSPCSTRSATWSWPRRSSWFCAGAALRCRSGGSGPRCCASRPPTRPSPTTSRRARTTAAS